MSIVRRRLLSGASWNLIDQALSALSNTVLSIVVARSATASDFGAFAIAFIVFGIFIAVTKSVVGQPLQIRFSGADMEAQSGAIRQGLGAALMIGVVAAVAVAGTSVLLPNEVRGALLALAVVLPALLLQDSCRMALFAIGRPRAAAALDAVWAAIMVALLVLLVAAEQNRVEWLIIGWGLGAFGSALLGLRAAAGATRSLQGGPLALGAMGSRSLPVRGVLPGAWRNARGNPDRWAYRHSRCSRRPTRGAGVVGAGWHHRCWHLSIRDARDCS